MRTDLGVVDYRLLDNGVDLEISFGRHFEIGAACRLWE